jgi:hypothetical protein
LHSCLYHILPPEASFLVLPFYSSSPALPHCCLFFHTLCFLPGIHC